MTKLILASSSPRRLELLESVKLRVDEVFSPDVDESILKKEIPTTYSKRIAALKMDAVISKFQDDCIITADTIVALGRRILLKPEDEDDAKRMLQQLSGRNHNVFSSVCVYYAGKVLTRTVKSVVKFKRLTEFEIELLVNSGEWEGKCGAYMIRGVASSFTRSINGSFSNIVGLPLFETCQMLKSLPCFSELLERPN
jgi:septum formation protein